MTETPKGCMSNEEIEQLERWAREDGTGADSKVVLSLIARIEHEKAENAVLRAALTRIADGGVPNGHLANMTERFLACVDIATEALK